MEFDSEAFLEALQDSVERGSGKRGFRCPICEGGEWTVVDAVMSQELVINQATTLHTALVVCENCAYIARFAIGQD